jgi:spore coat polysaccharide biosynthesis predicted glycosyltransferase SpsG/RimJ/RimL family protein N-acetyltransferase
VRLLLRADATAETGYGHVVRLLAVAETAVARGHHVAFIGAVPAGWLAESFEAIDVDRSLKVCEWQELPKMTAARRADAVVVDSYTAPPSLRRDINAVGALLANIEDTHWGRRPADVVIDQTWGAEAQARPADGSTVLLRGGRQALVRAAVRRARTARGAAPRSPDGRPLVVVVTGGTDATDALDVLVSVVVAADREADVVAVAPHGKRSHLQSMSKHTTVVQASPGPGLPALFGRADLVISAAGTTAAELCCIGVPMALLAVVPNQDHVVRAFVDAGAALSLGHASELAQASDIVGRLLDDQGARTRLGAAAVELVDGLGAARLLHALEIQRGQRDRAAVSIDLQCRPAVTTDLAFLLEWRNDPETRRWSRSSASVSGEEHRAWFDRLLADTGRHLLVVEDDAATPVGTVRWDRIAGATSGASWEVSITVAPFCRGRGLATRVLDEGETWLRVHERDAERLVAVVHRDNARSASLFSRAGYAPGGLASAEQFMKLVKRFVTAGPS